MSDRRKADSSGLRGFDTEIAGRIQTDQPVVGGSNQGRRPGFVCADVRERIAERACARVDGRREHRPAGPCADASGVA